MKRTRFALAFTTTLLACAAARVFASGASGTSGPEPAAKIDLQPLGYKPSDKNAYNITNVKWWKQYVVIDSTYMMCGKCGPDSTYTYKPGPRLVIDSSTGKQVPMETVADAVLEPNPQDFDWKHEHPKTAAGDIVAQWRGMTLVRGQDHRNLWLEEPGHERKLIFSHQYFESATFIAPDRILVLGRIDDNPDCTICHVHLQVIDKSGALRYKLPAGFNPGLFDYYALNRNGTRFTVRDNIEAGRDTVLDAMSLGNANAFLLNTGVAKVYEASDGHKLFEYKWRVDKYEHDSFGRVALSDDGGLLAVIQGHHLLIFRLPSANAHHE